jgi:cobalamin biosynthetic protein CobC
MLRMVPLPEQARGGIKNHGSNLIILRSFGKLFGLAGVRLGFVLAPPDTARTIRRWLGDWPVSGPAIVIGTAAYRDLAWQTAQRGRLAADAARLDRLIAAAGLRSCGGTALFRLIEMDNAEALFRHLAAAHILTRPFADNADRLRIGLPAREDQWARLTHALDAWRG